MKTFQFRSFTMTMTLVGGLAVACSSSGSGDDDDSSKGGKGGTSSTGTKSGGSGGSKSGGSGGSGGATASKCTDLKPTMGTAAAVPEVIISEIVHGQGIELYNTTSADIELTDKNFFLCSQLQYTAKSALAIAGGETKIPAKGYLKLTYPVEFKKNTEDVGEVVLYKDASFFVAKSVLDYVCWGAIPTDATTRRNMTAGGKNTFMGDCPPKPTNGSIARKPGTSGEDAASYDTTGEKSLENCGG